MFDTIQRLRSLPRMPAPLPPLPRKVSGKEAGTRGAFWKSNAGGGLSFS